MGNNTLLKAVSANQIKDKLFIPDADQPVISLLERTMPAQKIISGKQAVFIRFRMLLRIVRIIFRHYRNISESIRMLRHLVGFRRKALGENRVKKYAYVGGKYYFGLYTPGFYSAAFTNFILGEVNRMFPSGKTANRYTNVLISITKKCALRCEHCSEWETLNGEEKLSLNDIKSIVSRFQELGTAQFHFSGGEPLLRINDLLEVLASVNKTTECWVLTSGHKLTRQNAARLKAAGLTGVVISIDHFEADHHNRFRGSPESFKWAQKAVRNAIEANLVVAISICVTKSFVTKANMYSYAEMARQMGVSFIQIFEPKAVGHYLGKDVELTSEHYKILEDFFVAMNQAKAYREYPVVLYHGYYQRRIGCFSSGNRHVYVDSEGNMLNCPFCRKKAGNAITGNIELISEQLKSAGCSKFKPLRF
jgi:MoaA/NifB/PqqE/SkfB family radical SAM enzyme